MKIRYFQTVGTHVITIKNGQIKWGETIATCFDVAQYILDKKKELSATKLQKLVYYCQAWSLVWDEAALFDEDIEAWINGSVIRSLYKGHKGKWLINSNDIEGSKENLSPLQKETIDAVLDFYGDKNAQWLSDLTHNERPWKKARKSLLPNERGNNKIGNYPFTTSNNIG